VIDGRSTSCSSLLLSLALLFFLVLILSSALLFFLVLLLSSCLSCSSLLLCLAPLFFFVFLFSASFCFFALLLSAGFSFFMDLSQAEKIALLSQTSSSSSSRSSLFSRPSWLLFFLSPTQATSIDHSLNCCVQWNSECPPSTTFPPWMPCVLYATPPCSPPTTLSRQEVCPSSPQGCDCALKTTSYPLGTLTQTNSIMLLFPSKIPTK